MAITIAAMTDNAYINQIIAVCITAAVSGLVMLIGFIAVYRRFADKEVPAQLAAINTKFDNLDKHIDKIGQELFQMRRDIDLQGWRLQSLEKWKEAKDNRDGLDDTRTGPRRPRNT